MKRREFIAGLAASGFAGLASAEAEIRTIGILLGGTSNDPIWQSYLAAFIGELRTAGWMEGRNIHVEQRWAAGDPALMHKGAEELAALAPSAILAVTRLRFWS